jgi:peroxiredoxin
MLQKLEHKRLQSIIIIIFIAIAAIAGLFIFMSQLAAVESPAAGSVNLTPTIAIAVTATPTTPKNIDDTVVATINNYTITQQAWDKATRLDAVMNQLAGQPPATAEQTLDQLINEVIVLATVSEVPALPPNEVEARTAFLQQAWGVSNEEVVAALNESNLTPTDLTARVSRLIQVETALHQLTTQHANLDTWLQSMRASAEIGLYQPLAQTTSQTAANPEQAISISQAQSKAEPAANTQTLAPPSNMPVAPYAGNAAPDFTLPQLNGEPLTLSDFRGKPAIVNFWASWCPPCQKELPALQNAYTVYGDKIGFVAVDVKEDAGTVTTFIENMNLSFPIVLDSNGDISNVLYEVRGIPTTIFVDANGVVTARHVGPLDEATIDEYLAPLLEQTGLVVATANKESALTMITAEEMTATVNINTSAPEQALAGSLTMAPNFSAASGQGDTISLQNYRGQQNVVLVFYRGNT